MLVGIHSSGDMLQWQAEQLVKRKDKESRVFYPRCRRCTGVGEEAERGMVRVVNSDTTMKGFSGGMRESRLAVSYKFVFARHQRMYG